MRGLHGGLDLLAVADDAGRTVLRRQSFSPPIHISKPHHDDGWLVVNLASPTPGFFAGDRVSVRVEVEKGARLLLTTPSANRIHTMTEGYAELRQEFQVATGGWLDVWPEYLIPQARSRYHQHTKIQLAPGASLLWTETLAPGRVAMGEVFAFDEVRLSTDLFLGSKQLIRERYSLGADPRVKSALRRQFSAPYYASVICVDANLPALAPHAHKLQAMHSDGVWLGSSQLAEGAWCVKILTGNSADLRRTVALTRSAILGILGITTPSLRRVTGDPSTLSALPK